MQGTRKRSSLEWSEVDKWVCVSRRLLSGDTHWEISSWFQNSGASQANAADLGFIPTWRAIAAMKIDENRVDREERRKIEAWGMSRGQG